MGLVVSHCLHHAARLTPDKQGLPGLFPRLISISREREDEAQTLQAQGKRRWQSARLI
jgi:hypothetical protein